MVIQRAKARWLASRPATSQPLHTEAVAINQRPSAEGQSFQEFLFTSVCSFWVFWGLGLFVSRWNSPSKQGHWSPYLRMPTPHAHVALMTHTYILNAVVPEYKPGSGQNARVLSPMTVPTLFSPPGKSVSDLASAVISFKKTSGYFTHSVGISLKPISRNL